MLQLIINIVVYLMANLFLFAFYAQRHALAESKGLFLACFVLVFLWLGTAYEILKATFL